MQTNNSNETNTKDLLLIKEDAPRDYSDLLRENEQLREACRNARSFGMVYRRIAHALARNCVDLFYVNVETGEYIEYHANEERGVLNEERHGSDFFESCAREAELYVHPEDVVAFVNAMNRDFLRTVLSRTKVFEMTYRRIKCGRLFYVQMKATRVEEDERFVIIAVTDIDELVMKQRAEERMHEERLAQARSLVDIDALTGVKNKHAYLDAEARIDRQIAERRVSPFAIVVFDVNDLKKINDTVGHQAGDRHLKNARKIICDVFKHSPVYRVGGDEFAVIAQGEDFSHLEDLLAVMRGHNAEALKTQGIVIACGMAKFQDDTCVATVFDRADQNMYADKNRLKSDGVS